MADPRKVIDSETGKPLGDSMLDPWDRRGDDDTEEDGVDRDPNLTSTPRPEGGHLVIADTNNPNAMQLMKDALFGKDEDGAPPLVAYEARTPATEAA